MLSSGYCRREAGEDADLRMAALHEATGGEDSGVRLLPLAAGSCPEPQTCLGLVVVAEEDP